MKSASQARAAWLFMTPFLLLFATFTLYPLVQAGILAFQQTYGPDTVAPVGFANFRFLLEDPLFWKAVKNTTLFALASLFLQLPISLGLALWLNRPDVKMRGFFRLVFFSPALFGIVFVAMLFSLIFEKYTGLLNIVLHRLIGFDLAFPWLEEHVFAAIVFAGVWMYAGYNMVYFLAALQGVSSDMLEAAKIDGANAWQRLVHVTLPQIAPVVSFVVLLSLLGSFQLFELPWILLNGGGPDNAGLTVVMYLYQNGFEVGDLGYASAIGWVLASLLIVLAMIQRLASRRFE